MGVLYMPFFDASLIGTSITLSTAGESDVVFNLSTLTALDENSASSSIFSHYLCTDITSFDEESAVRFPTYARSSYSAALQVALRAAMTTATWPTPSNFNCSFSYTTGLITLSYSQNFGVAWGGSNTNAKLLGFPMGLATPTDLSGAITYTGSTAPYYVINSTLTDVSDESGVYEPDGLGNHVINDTGGGNSIARTQAPKFNDWRQEYENRANTYRTVAQGVTTTEAFAHEDLYHQCRTGKPFVLYGTERTGVDLEKAEVYSLRDDGMSFVPRRATPGSGSQFHIPYRCHLEGLAT
jgi:hypothetical protein